MASFVGEEFHDHLNATRNGQIDDSRSPGARKAVCDRLENQWKAIIQKYDEQTSSRATTLMQHQKLRNVYSVDVELNQLGTGIITYGWALTALTLIAALACGIWTYRNQTTSVVRASQPLFLILISIGVFVFGSSIIPMAIDDGQFSVEACDKACMAVPWLACMGWSILFSALYAKIRRVNLVVHNVTNFKAVKVSERDVMTPFAIVFSANLILLLVWTLVDPLHWHRFEVSPTESYGTCTAGHDPLTWKLIVALLATVNGAALLGANIEAWKARKIDTAYGESTYIGLIMASILQVMLVGVPLGFLVQGNPTARFFVNSSMAFVVCMSVLSLLFLPKVINVHENKLKGKGSTTSNGGLNSYRSHSLSEAAMIEDMKARVKNLQHLLQEAGIDGLSYMDQAGLSEFVYPGRSALDLRSSLSGVVESISRDPSRFDSLPPVAEEDDENHKELELMQEQSSTPPNSSRGPRSAISIWLNTKRPLTLNADVPSESASSPSEQSAAPSAVSESLKRRIEASMRCDE